MTPGAALRHSRERAGMSPEELAREAGVAAEVVEAAEALDQPLPPPQLERWLALYRATLPPRPAGWDAGHEHDAGLAPDARPAPPYGPAEQAYWERIDAWTAELRRGGWYRRQVAEVA